MISAEMVGGPHDGLRMMVPEGEQIRIFAKQAHDTFSAKDPSALSKNPEIRYHRVRRDRSLWYFVLEDLLGVL
ncbi:hypothetical protein [Methylobacter sp.]|uniref:hypothetical protein n=1 Tax=Methylobacter sp. TaxID=2051955 RepID=UPI001226BEFD|nr:hypothetical protein [Methylobacter sp.]TAK59493.1 MAG: hypothetical protein EPO18_20235 [Methylobacter sp.]